MRKLFVCFGKALWGGTGRAPGLRVEARFLAKITLDFAFKIFPEPVGGGRLPDQTSSLRHVEDADKMQAEMGRRRREGEKNS